MNWVCPECGARKSDFEMVAIWTCHRVGWYDATNDGRMPAGDKIG